MSRVGKQPIKLLKGVKVQIQGDKVNVEGPLGKLQSSIPEGVKVTMSGEEITVAKADKPTAKSAALHGLVRTVINNMVVGCGQGFTKNLEIHGVGFRAAVKGDMITLNLGFSHQVDFKLPKGITAKVDANTKLSVTGADKMLVGLVADKIRGFRPPEPYQGKGVRYADERIIRKVGKAAGAK